MSADPSPRRAIARPPLRRPPRAPLALALALFATAALPAAPLSFADATRIALDEAPSLRARREAVDGARALAPAAATLPDPRLTVGIDNLPVSGPDRLRLTRDFMTMQRIGVMQEVPNAARRAARGDAAQARVAREEAQLAVARLAVRRAVGLAWLGVREAEARAAQLAALDSENRLLLQTLDARIAAGKALPAERPQARQEALALADRRDDATRDIARARASLRRWVGARADDPLVGEPPAAAIDPQRTRAGLHDHTEFAPYDAMLAEARAEAGEAEAGLRGDWAWGVSYQRRGAQYGDMVSFELSIDLPWQAARRQQPQLLAKRKEAVRIESEREEMLRQHAEEVDGELAEWQSLQAQRTRLAQTGLPLAAERVALTLASYQAGRTDLAAVLAARRDEVETRLRQVDLDARSAVLQLRLSTLTEEP